MARDPFAQAPEFLTAFRNIVENGFFEKLEFSVQAFDGRVSFCHIKATGNIPSDQKYAASGIGVIVDPEGVIQQIRDLSNSQRLTTFSAEVKTEDWALWDKKEENVIGSKGCITSLFLSASFKI